MINFECFSCHTKLKAKDSVAGKKIKCPKCGVVVEIPAVEPPDKPAPLPATEKQKDYALSLGIKFSPDITKSEISKLLDIAVEKQTDERYEKLDKIRDREYEAYEEIKKEVLEEIDEEDCRLSKATDEQILEKFEEQDLGAILITFPIDDFDFDDLAGLRFSIGTSNNLSTEEMKKVISTMGLAYALK